MPKIMLIYQAVAHVDTGWPVWH